jgi:hypothetical protein
MCDYPCDNPLCLQVSFPSLSFVVVVVVAAGFLASPLLSGPHILFSNLSFRYHILYSSPEIPQRNHYQKNTTLRDDMTQSHNLHHRRAAAAALRRAPVPEPQLGFDPTAVFGGLTRTRGRGGFTDICEN